MQTSADHRTPFHPLVAEWFSSEFATPTAVQEQGWASIYAGKDTLLAAPTGSGKTLAAFLCAIDKLTRAAITKRLEDHTYVIYVSPLKALGNDIAKNLAHPLSGIRKLAEPSPYTFPQIRTAVRTGDTPAKDRQRQLKTPPHILVTTPESLYILLTAEKGRQMLKTASTVIIDEIHAMADDKRGSHLALTLERLDALAENKLQRIGLSATQKPIEEVARLLVGHGRCHGGKPTCHIIDVGHKREIDLRIETPEIELGPIASHEQRDEMYERLVRHVEAHHTTIIFVNTRRLVERVAHALSDRLGKERVVAHHGSMSRTARLAAEEGLRAGTIPVVVATASLELGIDVGHVDLVCHLGSPRSIATLLQRVGRSGHFLGAIPKGVIFPFTRDDLVQAAAAVRAVKLGQLDTLHIPENARDILAQQIVATVASEGEVRIAMLWALVRRAYPYRRLKRKDFDDIITMLSDGVSTKRGRRSAHLHYDRVNEIVRPRRGARLAAITGGGAIPDTADYRVIEDPAETYIGTVNEDFAIESMAGDIFLLGNRSWRIRRVEAGKIRVTDAQGAPPHIPFWLGEAPARTFELSQAVSDLRREIAQRLEHRNAAEEWLKKETGINLPGAVQVIQYVADTVATLGCVPTTDTIVAERFFDESGGMQLVLHSPLGGYINHAFGLALRKRFCVSFDFELQAAATDDGIVISLGEQHSFPLDSVFSMISLRTVEADLTQATLQSPMFTSRWRWNITRALALLRHSGGKRVPMPIQRMRAEDLLAAVFPAQVACGDNHPTGPIDLPDHPLVNETKESCLYEAMDLHGLKELLSNIHTGAVATVTVETSAPSPMSHEILNANPYAFLDDAPLEERRARAVSLRRTDPDLATGIGALDPAAIATVRAQAWPEVRTADELHDALLTLCVLPVSELGAWKEYVPTLKEASRVFHLKLPGSQGFLVPAERVALVRKVYAGAELAVGEQFSEADLPDEPVLEIARGWMEHIGPISAKEMTAKLALTQAAVESALARLESLGSVLQGTFTPNASDIEWCERGLLARIHRYTISKLRKEIEPVSPADLMRFLFKWQHVTPGTQLHGKDGIRETIAQLQGLELPGPAWEQVVLPTRIAQYTPEHLEQLCLSGEVMWGRLAVTLDDPQLSTARRPKQTRSAPLAFFLRDHLTDLLEAPAAEEGWVATLSPHAIEVLRHLQTHGASFLTDICRVLKRLPTEVEEALWQLVASGVVTGDGIAGLRTLLLPAVKRAPKRPRRSHLRGIPGKTASRLMPVGRWSLLCPLDENPEVGEAAAEFGTQQLLRRYGIVFRDMLMRERHAPRWREALPVLRRLEAQGQLRGGRFVSGFVGEQFALPEAIDTLRATRRDPGEGNIILIHASDPINFAGILTPGDRVSPFSGQVIAYRDGVPLEVGDLGQVKSKLQNQLLPKVSTM